MRQGGSIDVGTDVRAQEPQFAHCTVQFFACLFRALHGQSGRAKKAWVAVASECNFIIRALVETQGVGNGLMIKVCDGVWRDKLLIEAQRIHLFNTHLCIRKSTVHKLHIF